ncbi:MAG: hypothetical protein AB7F59_15440 [Bdellovibrionales bacterium]
MKFLIALALLFIAFPLSAADICKCKAFSSEFEYRCQDEYDCRSKCAKKLPEGKTKADCDLACAPCINDNPMPTTGTKNLDVKPKLDPKKK